MRAWTRATQDGFCGLCSEVIRRGDPVVLVAVPALATVRVRCRRCAGQPVPDDVPELPLRVPITPTAITPRRVVQNRQPFDPRRAAANDRDPGEEG